MDALNRVRLIGPARIGSRWLWPGDQEVTAEELAVLQAGGLIDEDEAKAARQGEFGQPEEARTFTVAEFEAAVEAAAQAKAQILAHAAFDGALAKLEDECRQIVDEAGKTEERLAVVTARAEAAEAECERLKARIAELEAAAAATPHTPPERKVAKTAPKKGEAATPTG